MSLREEGYEVFANTDASGTFNERLAAEANDRMSKAGVTLMGNFAVAMDLMRTGGTPRNTGLLPYFDKYLTAYGYLARYHSAAVVNGTL